MNIFSSKNFCDSFRIAYFSKQEVKPTLFVLGDRLWKLPAIDSVKPITESTFIDFYEPYEPELVSHQNGLRKVGYLPRACYGVITAGQWFDQKLEQTYEPSPTVLWSNFSTWDEFVAYAKNRRSTLFVDSQRCRRKLEKEVGSLNFVFDDRRPEVFDACISWKSAQWRAQELPDLFADERHVQLFRELAVRELLLVSSLSAGEHLIAVHIGMLAQGRLYSWVPAYDPAYARYSPGRLLLLLLLEESFKRRHTEFDFFIGGETYKWDYATHVRLIAEIGTPPLPVRSYRLLKSLLFLILSPFPDVKIWLRTFGQKLRYFSSI